MSSVRGKGVALAANRSMLLLPLVSHLQMVKRQKILGIYNPSVQPRPTQTLREATPPLTGDADMASSDAGSDSEEEGGEGGYQEYQQLVNVPTLPEEANRPAIEVSSAARRCMSCCGRF